MPETASDVNSWEITFPALDLAWVLTFYRHDLSWITGMGTKGGWSPAGPRRHFRDPINWSTQRAVARPKHRKTAGGGGYRGSATGEAQWPIGPRMTGRGIAAPSPSDTAGQTVGWEHDRGGGLPTGPRGTGNHRPTAGWSADISMSFLFPIQADWSGHICTAGPTQ